MLCLQCLGHALENVNYSLRLNIFHQDFMVIVYVQRSHNLLPLAIYCKFSKTLSHFIFVLLNFDL